MLVTSPGESEEMADGHSEHPCVAVAICSFDFSAFSTRIRVRISLRHAFLPLAELDDGKRLRFSLHVHVRFRGRHQC